MIGKVVLDKSAAGEKIKALIQGFPDEVAVRNKTLVKILPKINEGNPRYILVDIDHSLTKPAKTESFRLRRKAG